MDKTRYIYYEDEQGNIDIVDEKNSSLYEKQHPNNYIRVSYSKGDVGLPIKNKQRFFDKYKDEVQYTQFNNEWQPVGGIYVDTQRDLSKKERKEQEFLRTSYMAGDNDALQAAQESVKAQREALRENDDLSRKEKRQERRELKLEEQAIKQHLYGSQEAKDSRLSLAESFAMAAEENQRKSDSLDKPYYPIPGYPAPSRERNRDAELYKQAAMFNRATEKAWKANSRYEDTSGLGDFMQGVGHTASSEEFLSFGISDIAAKTEVRNIIEKMDEGGEVSAAETNLLESYIDLISAQSARSEDMSRAYQSGQMATESVPFMVEMYLTKGMGTTIKKSTKEAIEKMMEKSLKDASVGRIGKGLANFVGHEASNVARAVVAPSTYSMMADEAVRINEDGTLAYGDFQTAARGLFGGAAEIASEESGEAIQKAAGWLLGKTFGSGAKGIYNNIRKSGLGKVMSTAGFNGLIGEAAEEWYRTGLDAIAGHATGDYLGDKKAFKDFATAEQQLIMIGGFAPMSVIGMGANVAGLAKAKSLYDESLKGLQNIMEKHNLTETDIEAVTSYLNEGDNVSAVREMFKVLKSGVSQEDLTNEEAQQLYTDIANLAMANARLQVNEDAIKEMQGLMTQSTDVLNNYLVAANNPALIQNTLYDSNNIYNEQVKRAITAGFDEQEITDTDAMDMASKAATLQKQGLTQEADILLDLAKAKATMQGLRDASDIVRSKAIDNSRRWVQSIVREDGLVRPVRIGNEVVYMTDEKVSFDEFGAPIREGFDNTLVEITRADGSKDYISFDDMDRGVQIAVSAEDMNLALSESIHQENDRVWNEALNTKSQWTKAKDVSALKGKSVYFTNEEGRSVSATVKGMTQNGDVILAGKKGELGDFNITMNTSEFYDRLVRDNNGNVIINEAPQEQAQQPDEQQQGLNKTQTDARQTQADSNNIGTGDTFAYGDAVATITSVDGELVTAEYTDENGRRRTIEVPTQEAEDLVANYSATQQEGEAATQQEDKPQTPSQRGVPVKRDKNGKPVLDENKNEQIEWTEYLRETTDYTSYLNDFRQQAELSDEDLRSSFTSMLAKAEEDLKKESEKKPADPSALIDHAKKMKQLKKDVEAYRGIVGAISPQQEPAQEPAQDAVQEQEVAEIQSVEGGQPSQSQEIAQKSSQKKRRALRYAKEDVELGEYIDFRDYVMRAIATGAAKFIWSDSKTGTKGLGKHLDLNQSNEERNKRIWLLSNESGSYPEIVAQNLLAGFAAEARNPQEDPYEATGMTDMDALDVILDVLQSYSTPRAMFDAVRERHQKNKDPYYDMAEEEYEARSREMSVDEWIGYQEAIDKLIEDLANNITEEEYNRIFAENESYGQERTTDSLQQGIPEGQGPQGGNVQGDRLLQEEESDKTGDYPSGSGQGLGRNENDRVEGYDDVSAGYDEQPAEQVNISLQEAIRREPLRKRALELAKKLGVEIVFYDDKSQVKDGMVLSALNNGSDVTGWFNPKRNEVGFYLPNIKNNKDIEYTFVHEVVAHKGLPSLLGKDGFDSLCDSVWEMMDENARNIFYNYPGVDIIKDEVKRRRAAADEYIAYLSEKVDLTDAERSIWQKIVDFFRTILLREGFVEVTNQDIETLIRASYAKMAQEAKSKEESQEKNTDDALEKKIKSARTFSNKDLKTAITSNQNTINRLQQTISILDPQGEDLQRYQTTINEGKINIEAVEAVLAEREKGQWKTKFGVPLSTNKDLSIEQVRTIFNNLNNDKAVGELFDKVYERAKTLGLKIKISDALTRAAGNAGSDGIVKYAARLFYTEGHFDNQTIASILLHELIHTVTVYATKIHENRSLPIFADLYKSLPTSLKEACEELDNIYSAIKNNPVLKGEYGISSADEMLAELSNVEFRNKLKEINLWERLVNAIKKLFGFPSKTDERQRITTALAEAERVLDNMLENFDKSSYKSLEGEVKRSGAGRSRIVVSDSAQDRLTKQQVEDIFGGIWIKDIQEYAKFVSAVSNSPFEENGEGVAYTDNYFYAYYLNINGQVIPYASVYLNANESQDVVDRINQEIKDGKQIRVRDYIDRAYEVAWNIKSKNDAITGDNQSASNTRRNDTLDSDISRKGRYYDRPSLYVKAQRADRFGLLEDSSYEEENTAFRVYRSKDGKETRYTQLSLQFDAEQAPNDRSGANILQREGDTTLSTLNNLRELEEGEVCNVERVFTESKGFDFTRGEKIESADDIAYIFKNLEDEAIENVFVALVKDGEVTVIHVGMGKLTSSFVDFTAIIAAANRVNPEKVYLVHNHPSGNLQCSREDMNMLGSLSSTLGPIVQNGIIINTRSGQYGVFSYSDGAVDTPNIPTDKDNIPLKVYKFNKQAFKSDKINVKPSSEGIAQFVSTQRLGSRNKINALLLDNSFGCVGNVFLEETEITTSNKNRVVRKLIADAAAMNAINIVLYGRSPMVSIGTESNIRLSHSIEQMSGGSIRLVDVVQIEDNQRRSAVDYGVRFRIDNISSLEPSKVVDKIKDCFYDDVSKSDRIAMVEYLQQSKEGKDVIDRLYKHNGTGWAKQTVNATFVRIVLNDLLEGREPSVSSILTRGREHPVVKLIKQSGKEGVWRYVQTFGILGEAGKPINNVNGSFLSCNPSNECAKHCYATRGNYIYASSSVKSELVYWAIKNDPIRAAKRIIADYKTKPQYYEGKALRLFDKGDIDNAWLPVIEELNKEGVVTQIFSKQPSVLENVDRTMNVVMMSIDSSNTEMLDDYPTMPIALVYRGNEDLALLESCKERFKQYGGVILPVKIGQRLLSEKEIKSLPSWTRPYQCPIDNGKRLIKDKENPEHSWNCTKCDKNGGVGCFFKRTAERLRNKYENERKSISGSAERGNQRTSPRNAESSNGGSVSLHNTNNVMGDIEFGRELLRTLRESLEEGGLSDADITPELLEIVGRRLRRMLEGRGVQSSASALSENSLNEAGDVRQGHRGRIRPESDGRIATEDNTTRFRVVTDKAKLNELESGEKIEAYRAVQIDTNGTLHSPMASQIKSTKGGVKVINDAAQMNQWDEAVENVDKVDEKGRITIMDEDGGSTPVAYNPYGHCCVNSMMNDQFKRAYKRDNLYVMRVLAPVSELTSGYHAEKAKDAVGIHKWKTGVVGRQLPEDKRREILLTRWMKNVEVMSWEDVAQDWIKTLKGENISVPFNVIPRKILNMLSEAGIDIVAPEKGMENARGAYEQWLANPKEYVGDTNLPAQVKALNEQTRFRVANQNQEIFVSNAQRAVEGIKQDKATPQQWLAMITKQGGLKAGEDKWLGLSDWLKESTAKTITKQEILDYIGENKIVIEEQKYAKEDDARDELEAQIVEKYIDEYRQHIAEFENLQDETDYQDPYEYAFDKLVDKYGDEFSLGFIYDDYDLFVDDFSVASNISGIEIPGTREIDSVRLDYTTDGLQNKQEIALVVPTIESWNESDTVHFGDAGNGRAIAWIRYGDTRAYEDIEDVQVVDEFHEPEKATWSNNLIYRPIGSFKRDDYIVYGKAHSGNMIYVVIVNGKQIPVAHSSLEEARIAMNEFYKEHPRKLRKHKQVLVIDEIQSKRHQEGREKGYANESAITEIKQQIDALLAEQEQIAKDILHKQGYIYHDEEDGVYSDEREYKAITGRIGNAEQMTRQKEIDSQLYELNNKLREERSGIPYAPFDKNWHELAMKRMLRFAAENGYDYVAWTTGEQQAERYDLSKSVDSIQSEDNTTETFEDGTPIAKTIHIDMTYGESKRLNVDAEGNIRGGEFSGNKLSDVVGKDLAGKLMEKGDIRLSEEGLRIGGEGMKGFYDKMLPSFVSKYTKKWGAKVEDINLPKLEKSAQRMHAVNITPQMKEDVMQGQTMFRIKDVNDKFSHEANSATGAVKDGLIIDRLTPIAQRLGLKVRFVKRKDMPRAYMNDKGFYNTSTEEIIICPENHISLNDAYSTLLHEGVAHHGLRSLMGDSFDEFLDRVYNALPPTKRLVLAREAREKYGYLSNPLQVATEEYLATLAENMDFNKPEQTLWDKIKAVFNDIMRKLFGNEGYTISDGDLRYILQASYNHLNDPRGGRTLQGWAKDRRLREKAHGNDVNNIRRREGAPSSSDIAKTLYEKEVSSQWNKFQQEFQDGQQAVRVGIKAIQEETGGKRITDSEDYITKQNHKSSIDSAQVKAYVRDYYEPMDKELKAISDILIKERGYNDNNDKRSEVYNILMQYLISKHGLERDAYYNNEHAKEEDYEPHEWSGLSSLFQCEWEKATERAQELVKEIEEQVGEEAINALWEKIHKANEYTLRHNRDSGLITKEQYEKASKMFKYYIPLRGFSEKTAEKEYFNSYGRGNRYSPSLVTKGTKGRKSLADNPIATMMWMAENAISQGNKNLVKQAFYRFVQNRPNSLITEADTWYVLEDGELVASYPDIREGMTESEIKSAYNEFYQKMRALAKEGKAFKEGDTPKLPFRMVNPRHKNDHLIVVRVAGKDRTLIVHGDPALAKAVNDITPETSEFEKAVRKTSRIISSTYTTYSVDFIARNMIRDMIYSNMSAATRDHFEGRTDLSAEEKKRLNSEFDVAFKKAYMVNMVPGRMIKLLAAHRNGTLNMSEPLEREFAEFIDNGGQTGYSQINSIEKHKDELERRMKRCKQGRDENVLEIIGGSIELLNEGAELMSRFAAYRAGRAVGMSIQQSIAEAKEISVNFNRRGEQSGKGFFGGVARYLGLSKFFFNAGVQGSQNVIKLAKKAPLAMSVRVLSWVAYGCLMSLINSVLSDLFGDGEDEYWNLPEYVRQNNICLGWGKHFFMIPLPIEMRAIYSVGDIIASIVLDKRLKKDVGTVALDIVSRVLSVFPVNPIENVAGVDDVVSALGKYVFPDIAQPVLQALNNENFAGQPIYKNNPWDKGKPYFMRVYAGGPRWLTRISEGLFNASFNGKSGIDINPEIIDHLLSGYLGGLYGLVKNLSYTTEDVIKGNATLNDAPIARTLIKKVRDESFYTSTYWECKDVLEASFVKFKAMEPKATKDLLYGDDVPQQWKNKYNMFQKGHYSAMKAFYHGSKELEKKEKKLKEWKEKAKEGKNIPQEKIDTLEAEIILDRRELIDNVLRLY